MPSVKSSNPSPGKIRVSFASKEYAKKSVAVACHRFFYFFSVLIGPAGLGGSFTGFTWSFFINSAIARSS